MKKQQDSIIVKGARTHNLKNISLGNKDFITKMLNIFVKEIGLALNEIKMGELMGTWKV